jgi:2-C-methyl-D-erythritol 2,4-cyclodiphosphate synthase
MRVGFGFDVHKLGVNRDLILGGLKIPFEKGLQGVSDADVILHSISDALLGALAKGDIGDFFPPDSSKSRHIKSSEIIKKVLSLLEDKVISNLDVTIILERPRLKEYKQQITKSLSRILSLPLEKINLKIKSQENLIPPQKECILCCTVVSIT